jgi:hypothetical protein
VTYPGSSFLHDPDPETCAIQNCAALNGIRATSSGKITIVDQVLFDDFVPDQVLLDN